jgi:small subunit ribosomal protein S16
MLKIRLQRVGRKHDPSFRVVVTDSRFAAQSGKALEVLGSYNPRFDNPTLKEDRIKEWIAKGAQPSGTVHNILVGAGIIKGKKVNVLPKKAPIKKDLDADESASVKEGEDLSADESASVKEAEAEAPVATEEAASAEEVAVEEKTEEAVPDTSPTEEKTEEVQEETAPEAPTEVEASPEEVPAKEEK